MPRVAVLITDGRSSSQTDTIAAAAALRNESVTIFAIGAAAINRQELEVNSLAP